QHIHLAQLRNDLFGFVLLLGHSNVLLWLKNLLQGGPLFRGQTSLRCESIPAKMPIRMGQRPDECNHVTDVTDLAM
ncbi:MAG: hypothetical protein K5821_16470, partial [Nitrobacter sp.]|uniref:hypothetical protein n=1 Tax=Nitrobacter sp. TaxID=29420 RepID=UPI00262B2C2B